MGSFLLVILGVWAVAVVAWFMVSKYFKASDIDRVKARRLGVAVSDVFVAEPQIGSIKALFQVNLSKPAPVTVKVDFTTADGTAMAGLDYKPTRGTVVFLWSTECPGVDSAPAPHRTKVPSSENVTPCAPA